MQKAKPTVAKVSRMKQSKARKRNYLVEDSASDSGTGGDTESTDSDCGETIASKREKRVVNRSCTYKKLSTAALKKLGMAALITPIR